ncbi:hypothetical protein QR680_012464 [Steinernema hermaphroditum]|uniref:Uncharacterized protein n=1 Tax=Steinernema hermaphroditum TaxID=289476 RepID=A0AA39M0T3_9BILA|nr:hypothetical protein QR680_012464 [Steinernema hermaphroditum]
MERQKSVGEAFATPPEAVSRQHKEFATMLRLGSASLGCAVVVTIGICALSVCTQKIGIFFHLYLSLILVDCLFFVSSYFHYRLPSQGLLLPFYEQISASYNANRLVFASFYGQFAHKLATVVITAGWTFIVCLRPLGFGRVRRKKAYQIVALLCTWILAAAFSLFVFFTPLVFRVVGKGAVFEMTATAETVTSLLIATTTTVCTFLGYGALLVGSVILYAKKKLKTIVRRQYKKIAILIVFNGLLSWYTYFQIVYTSSSEQERKSLEEDQLPWLVDANTVLKHWFLVATLLVGTVQRLILQSSVSRIESVATSSNHRTSSAENSTKPRQT